MDKSRTSKAILITTMVLIGGSLSAQQFVISTFAGGAPAPTPIAAVSLTIGQPIAVATDSSGNVYFTASQCIFKLDLTGVVTRVAGNGRPGFSGDGGLAVNAQFFFDSDISHYEGLTVDRRGNLYVADSGNNRIRRISPTGIITTVAGTGLGGYSADNVPATSSNLFGPADVAVDGQGNLFIADSLNNRIREVSSSGIITTIGGNGTQGSSGDGGPANAAQIGVTSLALDSQGSVYFVGSNRVRKISSSGVITAFAGDGTSGYSGDGGQAVNAQLSVPLGVAVDGQGNVLIADQLNGRVRKVSLNGIINTVAGGGFAQPVDGIQATSAQIAPARVTVNQQGDLLFSELGGKSVIRRVSAAGIISTIVSSLGPQSGDGGSATIAQLASHQGIALDRQGNLFIGSYDRVRRVSPAGIISTFVGGGLNGVTLNNPYGGISTDASGNLFICEYGLVVKVSSSGAITTVAGTGIPGYSGDSGSATSAQISGLASSVTVDGQGNVFIADTTNQRVRKVSASGIITTVAGNGTAGFSGDGGSATNAQLNLPSGVSLDVQGNLLIVDNFNSRVRRVAQDGTISTVALFRGPKDPISTANPCGLAVDSSGNVFINDNAAHRILEFTAAGALTRIAGTGSAGYSGDGGPASTAQLYYPAGLALDGQGNVYVADSGNNAVRILQTRNQSVLIGAVLDAASETAVPNSPGKITVIYGAGLGPEALVQNQPANGSFGTQAGGTSVSFNGIPAPVLYASAAQIAVIAPYGISGSPTAQVTVSYQGQVSSAFAVPVAASTPSFFSLNGTGAGQIAAVNVDGSLNDAAHPVKVTGYVSLYATGEGQTSPLGVDGKLALLQPYPQPVLPVSVTVDGVLATFTYAGAAPTLVAGLMQIVVQIPQGVQPGGYVPVVLKVGNSSTVDGAAWIAVSGN